MQSDHHTEVHSSLYILPTQSRDINELLDIDHTSKSLEIGKYYYLADCGIPG